MNDIYLFGGPPQDPALLLLAALLSLGASLAAFRLRQRVCDTRGLVRISWIFLCGLEAGGGIWATHLIGILALRSHVASGYDTLRVLEALLVSVAGAALAFGVGWSGREPLRVVAGGLLLALAVAATHYVALSAWQLEARIDFEPITVWCSVVAGVVLGTAALMAGGAQRDWRRQAAGAVRLTLAVGAVHMVGVAAMTLTPDAGVRLPAGLIDAGVLGLLVVMLTVVLTLVGVGAAYIDDASSRDALQRSRRLADAAREGIVVLDGDGRIVDCNTAFGRMTGTDVEALRGAGLSAAGLHMPDDDLPLDRTCEAVVKPADEEGFPVEVFARALAESGRGGEGVAVVAVRDLRERREAERLIRHLADHDGLTGLPNRAALHRELADRVERAAVRGGSVMVACINVDNSKEVNETYGHAAGDRLLVKVAERLNRHVTAGGGFAARVGGNEFAFAFHDASIELATATDFLTRLSAQLQRPFEADGLRLAPAVSMGVTGHPHDAGGVSELLSHADLALKEAREHRGEPFRFFRHDYQQAVSRRRETARDLRIAVAEDQLVVFYQPQADVRTGEICGFEALVRWRHPERGLLGPDAFIPLAEETGLIAELGDWVLRRACADAAAWPRTLSVAVNLSPLQLGKSSLVTRVHEVLIETGLPPARLDLEITETALTADFQGALDKLRRLKGLGLGVAMDDFGTGYSSLSTLHSFPFDKIKIDKSFVDGVGKLERSAVLVRSVLGIGRGLGIPVVAEGVETAAQLDFLRGEECAEVQGYLIGRPAPLEAHAELLAAVARRAAA